jgi:hypothetical protein
MKKKDAGCKNSKKVVVTFSPTEYDYLVGKFEKTTFQYLPQMIRHLIFGKPVTVIYRNQSLDDFVESAVDLKNAFWATPNASTPELLDRMEAYHFLLLHIYEKCMQKQPFREKLEKL